MPVKPVITISKYAAQLKPNEAVSIVEMQVGDTKIVVRLDGGSNLFVDAQNAAGTEHTGVPNRHVAIECDDHVDPPPASDVVTFYDDINFKGMARTYPANTPFVDTANDKFSSVRVPAGKFVVLYGDRDYAGASLKLTADADDLRKFSGPGNDGTWNDAVSSLKLTDQVDPPDPPPTPKPDTTAFQTQNGHLLTVENGVIVATKTAPDGTEQFKVEHLCPAQFKFACSM